MLRLLIFVEPKPLPEHLFRNRSWLTFPLQLARFLHRDSASNFEISLAFPSRFHDLIGPYQDILGKRVYELDEKRIIKTLHQNGKTIRDSWNENFLMDTPLKLHREIDQQIVRSLPDQEWDIVLSFGEPCRYSIGETGMRLNIETAPFGRYPFQFSFFMDHFGMFRESALQRLVKKGSFEIPSELCDEVRNRSWEMVKQQEKLKFCRRYERYLMLPLQASNYPSFDAQSSYQTQLDYLFDVCSEVPADVGILLTEHPEMSSIDFKRDYAETLQGLDRLFPNLSYIPRAKYFSSASFCLLPQVDAVWTLASNVGPVASFWGVPFGTPSESHLNYCSDVDSVDGLINSLPDFDRSISNETRQQRQRTFDWIFQNYLIPWHIASHPHWFANYLQSRWEAFKEDPQSLDSFVPTNLKANDFLDSATENAPAGMRNHAVRRSLQDQVLIYRNRKIWEAKQILAKGSGMTCLLLNDTAKLENHQHIGCNYVNQTIQQHLQQQDYSVIQAVNLRSEIRPDLPVPDLVLINGEGSFHHNSPRIVELTEIAIDYKQRGSKIALINALWEANRDELAVPLKEFDLVSVRDRTSQQALQQLGIEAEFAPDLSLSQWVAKEEEPRFEYLFTDNIVYSHSVRMFEAMLAFGGPFVLLDDRQIARMDEDGCFAALPEGSLQVQLLTDLSSLQKASMVVTGRFHVAVACVAVGKPFVFVESNTFKISHLCQDVGLPVELLNVTDQIVSTDWKELQCRLIEAKKTLPNFRDQVSDYCKEGMTRIDQLFQSLARTSDQIL